MLICVTKAKNLSAPPSAAKNGYILQHGSILLDYDRELLEKIFKEEVDTDEITSIKEINPDITLEDLIKLFSEC